MAGRVALWESLRIDGVERTATMLRKIQVQEQGEKIYNIENSGDGQISRKKTILGTDLTR